VIPVRVVVQGQSEESFLSRVLAPAFYERGIFLTPIILGVPGQKGGRTNCARVRKDVLLNLKQERAAYCSTMLDHYGLGPSGINQAHLAASFRTIRDSFAMPEDINDDPLTAPAKRVVTAYPGYRKVLHGTIAAKAVGVDSMRRECPHFRSWLERLERLVAA